MLEKDLERKVVEYCRAKGILTYKFTSPAHRGVPDRVMIANGKVLFLELKREGQRPTALQYREIMKIKQAGGKAAWADTYGAAVMAIDFYLAA
jgi:Holliday junction resolvase